MTDAGFLFDLDGTVADTDPVHFEAFAALLREHGRELTHELFATRIQGQLNADIMRWLRPEGTDAEHRALADRKEANFRELAAAIEPLPGLLELIAMIEAAGAGICCVTNAPRDNAAHMLRALGLERFLPTIVLAEEIGRGKPDPLPYLTGLERLGVAAARAMAFEDSRPGIASARGAGLFTVGLTTGLSPEALRAAGASLTAPDYRDAELRARVAAVLHGESLIHPGS